MQIEERIKKLEELVELQGKELEALGEEIDDLKEMVVAARKKKLEGKLREDKEIIRKLRRLREL